ncbi:transposase family protein [Scytonema tolypothrichoides VB-61278]|nr:transposase family protein [Scytonema tolypothrichoides VB-61278]
MSASSCADYQLPEGSQLLQDLGFLAFTLDGVEMLQPFKKPRGGELTEEQKAANQALARRRVRIEHAICGVKRCRMVKDRIRLYAGGIRDLVMEVAVGLHNLRLRFRPWATLT